MTLGVLVDHEEESDAPYRAYRAEHVEDRWPAAVEPVLGQDAAQWHRDHSAKLGAYSLETGNENGTISEVEGQTYW